ncbi:hypothetical protein GPALN_003341 [Globodera pallida]|nr:hypothetical protein GPALN_003341 [Globodera pallida]
MDFVEWSNSVQIPIIYITICITIPSMALYVAEIVTIVRHKKFHNSFYALFVMRAIPMWRKLLPLLTIFVFCVPILTCWPAFKENGVIELYNPNSTTDRNFAISEAGDAPYLTYISYICAAFSVIFMILCVLLNIASFVEYKLHMMKAAINENTFDDIERKLLIYAFATFLGHLLVASLFLSAVNMTDPKIMGIIFVYYPVVMDTGTVVLSSWLLLWASGTFRQQLFNDFGIIRFTNRANIRVGAVQGHQLQNRNNNWLTVGRTIGHPLQTSFNSSVQQLPPVSKFSDGLSSDGLPPLTDCPSLTDCPLTDWELTDCPLTDCPEALALEPGAFLQNAWMNLRTSTTVTTARLLSQDWLGVLDSFYSYRLPSIIGAMWRKLLPLLTIFVFCVPILTCWPAFKENGVIELYNPNSTTDRNFAISEAGDSAVNMNDPKIMETIFVYYPVVMDTGTVVLSSWLLLWASGTFRQQLFNDFGIIRFTNRANIRVGAMQGHQLQNRNNNWLTAAPIGMLDNSTAADDSTAD